MGQDRGGTLTLAYGVATKGGATSVKTPITVRATLLDGRVGTTEPTASMPAANTFGEFSIGIDTGVGTVVAATLFAEAHDALRCLCGVARVTRQSGRTRIVTRRLAGHHWLRDGSLYDPQAALA